MTEQDKYTLLTKGISALAVSEERLRTVFQWSKRIGADFDMNSDSWNVIAALLVSYLIESDQSPLRVEPETSDVSAAEAECPEYRIVVTHGLNQVASFVASTLEPHIFGHTESPSNTD